MAQVLTGFNILLIALGAVLPWTLRFRNASVTRVGLLLMSVGAGGLLLSIVSFGFGHG